MVTTALTPRRTLVDAVFPWRSLAYQLAIVLGASLLVALFAQVAIPLPFTPVPITGQTYAVLLVGAALGSRRGALSMLVYLAQGGLGLPFFAGGSSGWARVLGPSGGYLLSYVLAAFVVGLLAERGWDQRFGTSIVAMILGEVVIYAVALPWLGKFVGLDRAVALGLLPFVPGDAVKLLLAAASLPVAWRILRWKGHRDRSCPY